MRIALTTCLLAILFCSSCMAVDQSTSKRAKRVSHTPTIAQQLSNTLTQLTLEGMPLVKAMTDEVSSELRGDWSRIREEWSAQMSRPWPNRSNTNTP